MWHSMLSDKPEYVHALGMISIEHNNVELFLGDLLSLILKVDNVVGRAIYWKPQSASLRIGIVEAVAEQMFRQRYPGSELDIENKIDADSATMLKKVKGIISKTRSLTNQRNDRIHTMWGTSGDNQEFVVRSPAFTEDPHKIVHVNELNKIVEDLRLLIGEIKAARKLIQDVRLDQSKPVARGEKHLPYKPPDEIAGDKIDL